MRVFDEGMREVPEPDLSAGRVERRRVPVGLAWVVDEPELTEERVVAEYPETGGRDVAVAVVSPERGHWEASWGFGGACPYDEEVPADWPHGPCETSWEVGVWVPYTEPELAERAAREAEAEAGRIAHERREAMLGALPSEQAAQDDALCALYEMCEAQRAVIDSQDDAICAVYEMMAGGE